jgi:chaperonin GroES
MRAVGKRVLIETVSPEKTTKSGIILAPKKEEPSNKGTVVSVGDEVTSIKVGDTIFFNKFTGAEIEHDEHKYLVIKLEDIYAII